MKAVAWLLALLFLLIGWPAAAQEVRIETKPPAREPREIVRPGLLYEKTRPSDHDFYPDGSRVEHDPAFVEALSGEYQSGNATGRVGVAGWTAPNTVLAVKPAAAGDRQGSGWLGFGFSVTWGGSPRAARPPTR